MIPGWLKRLVTRTFSPEPLMKTRLRGTEGRALIHAAATFFQSVAL